VLCVDILPNIEWGAQFGKPSGEIHILAGRRCKFVKSYNEGRNKNAVAPEKVYACLKVGNRVRWVMEVTFLSVFMVLVVAIGREQSILTGMANGAYGSGKP
jgi:hypothetical protein